jgi:hypothetical protein
MEQKINRVKIVGISLVILSISMFALYFLENGRSYTVKYVTTENGPKFKELEGDLYDVEEYKEGHYYLADDEGIITETTEKDWKESTKRIAFLLKDQNQDGFSWVDDTRKWLVCRDDNWNVESKFLRNIANALWGIKVSSPQYLPDPKSVKQYHEDITECFRSTPFAFVECKKQGGVSKLSNKALKTYLGKDEYKDLLYREFDILDANIFVCTNPLIYEFVQVYLTKRKCPGSQMTRVKSVSEKDKLEASVALHLPSKSIVLCSYHPSAIMSYENFFKGVVTHYQAFVQSPYYDEFFN